MNYHTELQNISHISVYKLHYTWYHNRTPHTSLLAHANIGRCLHSKSHSECCVFIAECFVVSMMLLPPVSTCRSKEILKCCRCYNELTVHQQL